MQSRRFVTYVFLVLFTCVLGYLSLVRLQHGSPVAAEWWVQHIYQYKQSKASELNSPKALILAGSSALFGFDSKLFQDKTGLETFNLSVHAGLDSLFYYHQLDQLVGSGDLIIMPLEYEHYTSESANTHWFVSNMLAWGQEIYLDRLSLAEYLTFVADVPPERIWSGLMTVFDAPKLLDQKTVFTEIETANAKGRPEFVGYSHKSMNLKGDILVSSKPLAYGIAAVRKVAMETGHSYIEMPAQISAQFVGTLKRIQQLVEDRGATLVLTWPPSIRNKKFDFASPETRTRFESFNALLLEQGIKVQCNPVLFNMHPAFFYDNLYHLNAIGGQLRTLNIANCISKIRTGSEQTTFDYEQSLRERSMQEKEVLRRRN